MYAEKELRDVPAIDDFVGLVGTEIRGRLAGGPPTVVEIASAIGLSTRTLQRRLAIARRSFEAVLDEVRRARAEELLADDGWDFAKIAYSARLFRAQRFYASCNPLVRRAAEPDALMAAHPPGSLLA